MTTLTWPAEERARLRRYLTIMGIAVALFVSLPFLPRPLAFVAAFVAAVCLPTAAIVANQPRKKKQAAVSPVDEGRAAQDADPKHRVIDPD